RCSARSLQCAPPQKQGCPDRAASLVRKPAGGRGAQRRRCGRLKGASATGPPLRIPNVRTSAGRSPTSSEGWYAVFDASGYRSYLVVPAAETIYARIRRVPAGFVTTYGDLSPGAP